MSDPHNTRVLVIDIPAAMDSRLAKFVGDFAEAMAKEMHAAEQVFSHHDAVLVIEKESGA